MTHAIICYVYNDGETLGNPVDVRILDKYDQEEMSADGAWLLLSDYDSCGRYKVPPQEVHVLMMLDLRIGLPVSYDSGDPVDVMVHHYDDDED